MVQVVELYNYAKDNQWFRISNIAKEFPDQTEKNLRRKVNQLVNLDILESRIDLDDPRKKVYRLKGGIPRWTKPF